MHNYKLFNLTTGIVTLFFVLCLPLQAETINDRLNAADEAYYSTQSNMFGGGALMYRPPNTQDLAVFDLNKVTVMILKYAAPRDCIEIIIGGNDGLIFSGCIQPSDINEIRRAINPKGEAE